jgi:hypothetical protein
MALLTQLGNQPFCCSALRCDQSHGAVQRVFGSTTLLRAFARMNAVKVFGCQSDALD